MKKVLIWGFVLIMIIPTIVNALPPDKPGENGGPNGGGSTSVTYKGATTISESSSLNEGIYTSKTGGENALLVNGGESTINNITVEKGGDESSENSDFYGTNAGVFVYNNASLTINNGNVTTNGSHANAIFSYGTGKIILNNLNIATTGNNSGGVMVTGGGTLNANNCTVKTSGNSSASIRSDRGGGTLTVENGSYETNGGGSPAIYSTANITVKNATLTSTHSEGVVVEGANSITLENVQLTDTNDTLNGNSETYKNVFLYQSMSGDADEGTATFTASNSNFVTNNGDTIFVTNTKAVINLTNNTFTNTNGDFLRIQTGKWGTSGKNGGNVTMNLNNQKVSGNIIVDSISSLELGLKDKSVFLGSINNANQGTIKLTLSSDSILSLTEDTYVNSLENEVTDNSNIYANGHKLYVNNVDTTINQEEYDETIVNSTTNTENNNSKVISTNDQNNFSDYIVPIIVLVIGIVALTVTLVMKKRKNK